MGLLVAWGDDANFVVSRRRLPPAVQAAAAAVPQRRGASGHILNTAVARIRVEGYFAVTTNTVQFGARVEVVLRLRRGFGVDGHLASTRCSSSRRSTSSSTISASVLAQGLRASGCSAFGSQFALEGPTPWRAHGTGSHLLLVLRRSTPTSTSPGAKQGHDAAADRRSCRCCARELDKPRTGARSCPPTTTCWSRCASLTCGRSRSGAAPARRRCGSASARCRSTSRSTRSATRSRRTPTNSR